jgi:hypothetical protein
MLNLIFGVKEKITYINLVSKVNKHDSAWSCLAACTIQADNGNHVHTPTLDEVHVGG